MTEDLDRLAKGLTEAERAAILLLGPFIGCRWPMYEWEGPYRGISKRVLNGLHAKGLTWGRENYQSRYVGLLPLGLALRNHLKGTE